MSKTISSVNDAAPSKAISRVPPLIPFHWSTPPSPHFSPMISARLYPRAMPWRKRNASRRLLLPVALAPTSNVSGPSCSSASRKFLKFSRRSLFNIRIPPSLLSRNRQLDLTCLAKFSDVLGDRFEDRSLVRPSTGQFDHCLEHSREQRIAPQPALVEIGVNVDDAAGLPQLHQTVDLVDQRDRSATPVVLAERLALALVPRLEPSRTGRRRAAVVPNCLGTVILIVARRDAPGVRDEIEFVREVTVGQSAGYGVKDAGSDWR